MNRIFKTFKFELCPTKNQMFRLNRTMGCCRFIYNYFLEEHIKEYAKDKKITFFEQQSKQLTELKKNIEYVWLNNVSAQSLQQSLKHLQAAYTNYFKHGANYPKFKSKKRTGSFTVPQNITISNDVIKFPKFNDGIKINQHRIIEGKIKKCIVTRTTTEKYFVSILCEVDHTPSKKTDLAVGIDLGLKHLAITSDNIIYENHKYFQKYKTKIVKLQSSFDKKPKGSKRREKHRLRISKIYEKITNSRKDSMHKITTDLVKTYDIICVENLEITEMLQNKLLAKFISDANWGRFLNYLEYKCEWNGKNLIKVGKYFPSSKLCNICGEINNELTLNDRVWICSNNHRLDRDLNASQNILKEGLRILNCSE